MKFNYVRIFALFILLVSVGMFTSCGHGGDTSQNSPFVGSWKLVKVTLTGETPDVSEFQGFSIALNSAGSYSLSNPTNFPSPTGAAGTYTSNAGSLSFNPGNSVQVSISGNTMVWEWQVAKPGKTTASYRYTFERM